VQIPEHERDPDLARKLEPEWPAILRWMIDGCLEWRRSGLMVPPIVRDATDSLSNEDHMGQWLAECTEPIARAWTRTADLFRSWREWCEKRNSKPRSEKAFSETLAEKGYLKKREPGTGYRGLANISLKGLLDNATPTPRARTSPYTPRRAREHANATTTVVGVCRATRSETLSRRTRAARPAGR
jgi:phage/plasmid-associated DNA primase